MIHRNHSRWYFLLCFSVACAGSTVPSPIQPAKAPSLPGPTPSEATAGSWAFSYAPGTISYQVSRSASIQLDSDSSQRHEISTNTTHEQLTLESIVDTVRFSALIDTFSTTTDGVIGAIQGVQLPVRLIGSLVGDTLTIGTDSPSDKCSPTSSALATDLRNLLISFPAQLSRGMSWRDSVLVEGCQAMIPTTVRTTRSFVVTGETAYQGSPVIVVQRTDTLLAHGEGAQQQHRLVLDAGGSGNAVYYLSPQDGHIVHLSTSQDLRLSVTASGKTNRFKQSSKQEFSLGR
jgi:hypothetical protein